MAWTSIIGIMMMLVTTGNLHAQTLDADQLIPDFLPKSYLPFRTQDLPKINALSSAVRWKDIKGWRPLGGRWAAALNDRGATIAIYDLSVTESIITADWVLLGSIGGPGFNLKTVRETLAARESQPKSVARALRKLNKLKKADLERNLLPENWFKSVPWTAKARQEFAARGLAADAEPAQFNLSDIDLDSVVVSHSLFHKALNYLKKFNIDLAHIQFVHRTNGGYDIYARGPASAHLGHPIKVADLTAVSSGFWNAIGWTVGYSVMGFAIGLIPIPVVSALVGTALDRYLMFEKAVLNVHREAAREMVALAEEGSSPYSAFAPLSPIERKRAGISMYISDATLVSTWNWIFKGGEKSWRDNMRSDQKRASKAATWLTQQGESPVFLNSRYAFGQTADKHRRLYVLQRTRQNATDRPFDAVDYANPNRHVAENIAAESASIIVDFGTHFIPWVGGLVSDIFDLAVRSPVQYSKSLEARLAGLLEERQRVSHEDWSFELATIDRQLVNPFELTRAKATELIAAQRVVLGFDPRPILQTEQPAF